MHVYSYWSNEGKAHEGLLFEVTTGEGILVADKFFQDKTGIDPVRTPWVGVTITELESDKKELTYRWKSV